MRRGAPWFNQGANTHWSSFNPDRARGYVLYRESSAGAHCFSSRLDALCRGALLPPPSCVPWSNESDGTILPLRRRVAEQLRSSTEHSHSRSPNTCAATVRGIFYWWVSYCYEGGAVARVRRQSKVLVYI